MGSYDKQIKKECKAAVKDPKLQRQLKSYTSAYWKSWKQGVESVADIDGMKKDVAFVRQQTLQNLDKYLLDFESNVMQRGGKVLWAKEKEEALALIQEIIGTSTDQTIFRGQSKVLDEIDINDWGQRVGIPIVESSTQGFISYLAGEKASHPITPTQGHSYRKIKETVEFIFGGESFESREEIDRFVIRTIGQRLSHTKIGIFGANFLSADTGGAFIQENEGNLSVLAKHCSTKIIVASIEKVVPSIGNLSAVGSLQSIYAGFGAHPAFQTLLHPDPKYPAEIYFILLDNERTHILQEKKISQTLECIQCNGCKNICPIHQKVGGSVYPGPIESILSFYTKDPTMQSEYLFACTLCGACQEICPVNIPLTDLIEEARIRIVDLHLRPYSEGVKMNIWRRICQKRTLFNFSKWIKSPFLLILFSFSWLKHRKIVKFAVKPFAIWK